MVVPIVIIDVTNQIVQQLVMKLVYPVKMAINTKEELKLKFTINGDTFAMTNLE